MGTKATFLYYRFEQQGTVSLEENSCVSLPMLSCLWFILHLLLMGNESLHFHCIWSICLYSV